MTEIEELREQLAAAQLQIKTLREDLEAIAAKSIRIPAAEYAMHALSTPQDLSALHAYGKRIADAVEKLVVERCAKAADLSSNCFTAKEVRVKRLALAAIRALPLGQIDLEDLK